MIILNNNQPPEELNKVYETDYYWYLKSVPFREKFLKPLGMLIDSFGTGCLDVGCGEGWLSEYVADAYMGIDGSRVAIERARTLYPHRQFEVCRFEAPRYCFRPGVVVFGGILDVLVAKESYLELLKLYQDTYDPTHFVIYDLERFDDSTLRQRYVLEDEYHASVDMDLQDVKRHRKILVFRC